MIAERRAIIRATSEYPPTEPRAEKMSPSPGPDRGPPEKRPHQGIVRHRRHVPRRVDERRKKRRSDHRTQALRAAQNKPTDNEQGKVHRRLNLGRIPTERALHDRRESHDPPGDDPVGVSEKAEPESDRETSDHERQILPPRRRPGGVAMRPSAESASRFQEDGKLDRISSLQSVARRRSALQFDDVEVVAPGGQARVVLGSSRARSG